MPSIRVLRDIKARHGVNANEIARRAYLYVARNQSLPPSVRYQAQLQLNTFGRFTRPSTVKNRCSESGKGRGIMSEFALSRVSPIVPLFFTLSNTNEVIASFNSGSRHCEGNFLEYARRRGSRAMRPTR